MGIVRNLMVRAGADFSPLETAMRRSSSEMKAFGSKMESALVGIKGKLLAIGAAYVGITGLKDATRDSIELEATTENLNHILGQSSQAYVQWSQTVANSYGFSQVQAEKYGASFAHMISLFTNGSQQITQRTEVLMKTAAIIANGTGRSIEDVMQRIQSGMLGNVQAINDLGVYANQSMLEMSNGFKEIANGRSWDQLTMAERQQVIYLSIMEQASKQYGDTLQNNVHNKLVTFTASLKNLRANIGNAFLPILNVALPALTALAQKLVAVASYVSQFMQALFGIHKSTSKASEAATNKQTDAVNKLSDSYTKAGNAAIKAAKQAKGSLAGIDEINALSTGTSSSGGGGGDAGGGQGDIVQSSLPESSNGSTLTKISDKVKNAAEAIRSVFIKLAKFIKDHKDIIIASVTGMVSGIAAAFLVVKWGAITEVITDAFLAIRISAMETWAAITGPIGVVVAAVVAVVAILVGSFIYFYRTNEKFRGFVDGILKKIKEAAIDLWNNALKPLGSFLKNVFIKIWNELKREIKELMDMVIIPLVGYLKKDFLYVWDKVKSAFTSVKDDSVGPLSKLLTYMWKEIIQPLSSVLKDVFAVAFQAVSKVGKELWVNVLKPLGAFLQDAFKPTVDAIIAVLLFLWKYAFKPLGELLLTTIVVAFKVVTVVVKELWYNVFKPLVPFITYILGGAFKSVGEIIGGLKHVFIGLMNFITGVFTGDWSKAWNGIKYILKGVFESLWAIVKYPLNLIIDGVNQLIKGLNKISFTIPHWVPFAGGKSYGISIPKIPHLAQGGYVGANSPMLALIGDNRTEGEIVSPESKIYQQTYKAINDALSKNGSNGNFGAIELVVNLGGTRVFKTIIDGINDMHRQAGKTLIRV